MGTLRRGIAICLASLAWLLLKLGERLLTLALHTGGEAEFAPNDTPDRETSGTRE